MASYKTPKGCIVHRIELQGGGSARIGYRCNAPGGQITSVPHDEHGRTGMFDHGGGATGTYPQKLVRGVRAIDFRGITVSGDGVRAGFVLSPAAAVCRKDARSTTLSCKLVGDTSSAHLSGTTRKRRKKSR